MNQVQLAWSQIRPQLGQLLIAVATIALGVALAAAILLSNASLVRSFEESLDVLAGEADLQVTGLSGGVVDETLVETVRAVPGVDVAAALLVGTAYVDAEEPMSVRIIGVDMLDESSVEIYRARAQVAGMHDPLIFLNQPDSVLFTASLAEELGAEVGDRIPVELPVGRRTWTLRGLLDEDAVAQAFGGRLVVMDLFGAQRSLGAEGGASQIDVRIDPTEKATDVGARLRGALPEHLSVELLVDRREDLAESLTAFHLVIDLIGGMGLLLAILVTGNRLSTVYQERLWEMGVMRSLGTSRAKLVRDLLFEAFLISLLAVAVGLPLGYLFAQIIVAPVADTMSLNFKQAVAAPWVPLRPLPLFLAGLAGVLSALVAALVPAVQAVRRSVITVLTKGRRRDPEQDSKMKRYARIALPLVAVLVWLLHSLLPQAVVVGAAMLLIGATGALLLSPLLRLVAKPIGLLFGVAAHIGVEDQSRVPSRALGAAGVLMVGIAIPIWMAGVSESFQEYVVDAVMRIRRGDLVVESRFELGATGAGRPVVSEQVIDLIKDTPGVADVGAAVLSKSTTPEMGILGLDPVRLRRPEFGNWALEPGAVSGALERVARGEAVLVDTNLQSNYGVEVGQPFRVTTPAGLLELPVAGVLRTVPIVASGDLILSREVYRREWKDETITRAFVLVEPGQDIEAVRRRIADRLEGRYRLDVKPMKDLSEWFAAAVRAGFGFVRVLAALTLVVVLFGCGDALAANVLERTRELGSMRALGMSRAQIRQMVLAQAFAIGVTGSGLAILVGLSMGVAFTEGLIPVVLGWELEFHPTIGVALLGGLLGTTACVLGAAIPAERAARLSPAAALRYD
ncbi:MAG: ABC transporter permease [Candidatus Binatia bacterium]|nr:ABC transporter permease [Candidatus Binatia bacterium]